MTQPGPEISVIVPTFCEQGNIAEVVGRLRDVLAGVRWEIVFVDDDSPDGTSELARAMAQEDASIRCMQRIGRRGLSSAVIEGILATSAPVVAVMDADLQHDERLLPQMLDLLRREQCDVVVASRYVSGGGIGDWDSGRASISRLATRIGRLALKADLTDPMSGFFAIRRNAFMQAVPRLSGIGFKILLDIFASAPTPLSYVELPYTFRARRIGESKLDSQAAWGYVMLLLDKLIGRFVPVRFIAFGIVGLLGLAVHLLVLDVFLNGLGFEFVPSQAIATFMAMTFNFALNNELTYRDMRLRGLAWLRGWLSFSVACSVGAVANVGIAAYVFAQQGIWFVAAIAGVLVGAVWNYAVTMVYTWRRQ